MDNDATLLFINGEDRYVKNVDEFARIVGDLLGRDAAEYIKEHCRQENPENPYTECNGECDKTYEIQQNYENILHEIQDTLEGWDIAKMTKAQIESARDRLYEKIDREL